MSIMPIGCLVFNVRGINGNFPGLLFRSPIDLFIGQGLGPAFRREHFGNGLRQRRLAVIDVTDGSNIDVRFVATEDFRSE
jgi:hypothetical protein